MAFESRDPPKQSSYRGLSQAAILPGFSLRTRVQTSAILVGVRDVPASTSQAKDWRGGSLDLDQVRFRGGGRNIPQPVHPVRVDDILLGLFSFLCGSQQSGSSTLQLCTEQLPPIQVKRK